MADCEEPQVLESLKMLSLEKALQCSICEEVDTELKTLTCCKKLMCLPCIEKLFADEEEKQLHEGTPICSFCQRTLTKKPQEYPANKMVQHFQAWATSLKYKEAKKTCQVDDCTDPVEKHCKGCKTFLCTRCSLKCCLSTDDVHETTEMADCVAESKKTYLLWKAAKEQEIDNLNVQLNGTFAKVKEQSRHLSSLTDDPLAEELERTISDLTKAQTEIGELNEKITMAKSTLCFVVDSFGGASEVELAYLVHQLQVYENARKVTMGKFQALLNGVQCYDVVWSPSDHLVVARSGGVDVLDTSGQEPRVIKSLSLGGHAFSLGVYKDTVIVGMQPEGMRFQVEVITLDDNYEEVRRWEAKFLPCDLAIAHDKIIFSVQTSPNLKAFTRMGTPLPDVVWNGMSAGVAKISSSSIVLADYKYSKVYRKSLATGDIQWSLQVEKPFSMCVDAIQSIWIRSNDNNCMTILSPQGEKLQEIDMKDVTSLGNWTGITVHEGYLYICHKEGVGRLQLFYHSN